MRPPATEDWLARFLPRLREGGSRVLDIGCGPGLDADYLAARGFEVVAFDRRDPGWGFSGRPRVFFLRADVRWPPVREGRFDIALASLSLHYLPWSETVHAFGAAAAAIRPGGLFLFRVNASDDYAHGAGEGDEIEPGFFLSRERPGWSDTKRFFTERMLRDALPPSVAVEHLAHRTIHRYEEPKRVWECLAVKAPAA
jgi:SAM-dependent methyltransferase